MAIMGDDAIAADTGRTSKGTRDMRGRSGIGYRAFLDIKLQSKKTRLGADLRNRMRVEASDSGTVDPVYRLTLG
jgi:hypothetical protein